MPFERKEEENMASHEAMSEIGAEAKLA